MDPTPIDPDLIYAKTASGEDAMQHRTRVVQRNVRMVLILVDGNATVAELCNRTGNAQLTQNALLELENDGFIERRTEKDSVWVQGAKHGRRGKASVVQPPSEFSTYGNKDESALLPSLPPGKGERRTSPFSQERDRQSSLAGASMPTPSILGPESGTVFSPIGEIVPDGPASRSAGDDARSLFSRLKAGISAADEDTAPDLKPISRPGFFGRLGWPMRLLVGGVLLSAVLFLTAVLFPYALYLPEVEDSLAQSIGVPVKVGQMRPSFYPKPGLLLDEVVLGDDKSGRAVPIGAMRLQPALTTLLSSRKLFREVELSDIELSAETVGELARMLSSAASESAKVGLLRLTVDKARISFGGLGVGDMRGELGLSPEGLMQTLTLQTSDRNLQIEASPIAGGLTVKLEGLGWTPAEQSPYLFDSLIVKGEILGSAFVVDSMEWRIFGGLVQGAAVLRAERGPAVTGEIAFERIDVKRFGEALGVGGQFAGEAAGRLKFAASAATWPAIFAALHADGEFTVTRGVLGGIDLPEALRRVPATPVTLGGGTRFEQMSGQIRWTPTAYQFSRLILTAGLMQSSGQLEVNRERQLRGRMEVQMRGRTDHSAKSVAISGPLNSPQLRVPATP
ncbi:hypothetical protein [Accumulibacter sp.]|uniref:hypothetical protein n=1 Tax=Accumulibacter sp. TaxID=2053492 RepID=UPI0026397EC1|nr:hypothetical protein [Accumulibacter sp.]